mmetsp:Transcript_39792/g.89153  ORF Transcript_39792/g.89153 Transcript_39792/m.89153 type:complete len:192 (-) Transcript_39792:120-695(-)
MTSQTATFERQLLYSLVREKDAALQRYISGKHSNCDEDHTQVAPQQQRAHLTSAYVFLLGEDFGFDSFELAQGDRFLFEALEEVCGQDGGELSSILRSDMSVADWVSMLLADINNQAEGADRLIDRDCLFKWAAEKMGTSVAHEIFYDEERAAEYGGQIPTVPLPQNKFQPFLSRKVLVRMLLTAGMLTSG